MTGTSPSPATPREAAVTMLRDAQRIFIAYSHADVKRASDLHRRIARVRAAHPPDTTFLDQVSLRPGDSVAPEDVRARLLAADLMVILCGRDTAVRPHVAEEVALGLDRQSRGEMKILPIILRGGVRLPDGLDYRVQGIFAEVLFPEIRWQRLGATAAVVGGGLVALAVLSRATWAAGFAPTEAWTLVAVRESGWSDALLVRGADGEETVRTRRAWKRPGTFAEDVGDVNDIFLELNATGAVTGGFATTRDDAGLFHDERAIKEVGGLGTLADEARLVEDGGSLDANTVWNLFGEHASRCLRLTWFDGFEELIARAEEIWSGVKEESIRSCRLGPESFFALFPTDFGSATAWVLTPAGGEPVRVPLDATGVLAIAKRVPNDGTFVLAAGDTRWEDNGRAGGLFRSTDGGTHWMQLKLPNPWNEVMLLDVALGLGRSRRIAVSYLQKGGGTHGVLVSDDDGADWRALRTGLRSATAEPMRLIGVGERGEVWVALPGGRVVQWRALSFMERFVGVDAIDP
jgi:hypothetical protein